MSVNNKDIIRMYLLVITQKALPINAFFVNSKQLVHRSKLLLILTIYSFDFFLG